MWAARTQSLQRRSFCARRCSFRTYTRGRDTGPAENDRAFKISDYMKEVGCRCARRRRRRRGCDTVVGTVLTSRVQFETHVAKLEAVQQAKEFSEADTLVMTVDNPKWIIQCLRAVYAPPVAVSAPDVLLAATQRRVDDPNDVPKVAGYLQSVRVRRCRVTVPRL